MAGGRLQRRVAGGDGRELGWPCERQIHRRQPREVAVEEPDLAAREGVMVSRQQWQPRDGEYTNTNLGTAMVAFYLIIWGVGRGWIFDWGLGLGFQDLCWNFFLGKCYRTVSRSDGIIPLRYIMSDTWPWYHVWYLIPRKYHLIPVWYEDIILRMYHLIRTGYIPLFSSFFLLKTFFLR